MDLTKYLKRQFEYYKDGRLYTVTKVRRNKVIARAGDIILAAKSKIFESWINQGKVKFK